MIGLFIALAILLGVGGTVTVADNARPGDALFGVDQAVEKLRINIARKENKNELRIKFAEERVKELKEFDSDDGDDSDALEDDADSSSENKKELTGEQRERISTGINDALNLLTTLEENQTIDLARLEALKTALNSFLLSLPEDAKIEINGERLKIKFEIEAEDESDDSDKSSERKIKIEEMTTEGRIRLEIKDGSLEIKTKLNDDDDDSSDDGKNGLDEIEAKILSDKTIIKVEIGDEETTFVTSANTREAIIAAIVANFPSLTSAQVDAVLKIETENDAEDVDEDSDDGDDEDKDDEDENDDSDDDNSGSN